MQTFEDPKAPHAPSSLYTRFTALPSWRRVAVGASASAAAGFVLGLLFVLAGMTDSQLFAVLLGFWGSLALACHGFLAASREDGTATPATNVFTIGATLLIAWYGFVILSYLFDHHL